MYLQICFSHFIFPQTTWPAYFTDLVCVGVCGGVCGGGVGWDWGGCERVWSESYISMGTYIRSIPFLWDIFSLWGQKHFLSIDIVQKGTLDSMKIRMSVCVMVCRGESVCLNIFGVERVETLQDLIYQVCNQCFLFLVSFYFNLYHLPLCLSVFQSSKLEYPVSKRKKAKETPKEKKNTIIRHTEDKVGLHHLSLK